MHFRGNILNTRKLPHLNHLVESISLYYFTIVDVFRLKIISNLYVVGVSIKCYPSITTFVKNPIEINRKIYEVITNKNTD